jgi:hypothetical protein
VKRAHFVPGWRDLEQVCGVGGLWVCEASYPLLCSIWSVIPFSICLCCVNRKSRLFVKNLMAASLYWTGWQESLGMIVLVVVGFLYTMRKAARCFCDGDFQEADAVGLFIECEIQLRC